MTVNQDQVSRESYDHSLPVPNTFVVTFTNGRDYWRNQENGTCTDLEPAPILDDVEPVIVDELEEGLK